MMLDMHMDLHPVKKHLKDANTYLNLQYSLYKEVTWAPGSIAYLNYIKILQEYILSSVNNNQSKHIKCYVRQWLNFTMLLQGRLTGVLDFNHVFPLQNPASITILQMRKWQHVEITLKYEQFLKLSKQYYQDCFHTI